MNSEALNLVFNISFDLHDLFKIFEKNICEDWKKLIDKILINRFNENNELVIFLHSLPRGKSFFNYHWNYDGKKVNFDNYLFTEPYTLDERNEKYFKLVKKLYIISTYDYFSKDLRKGDAYNHNNYYRFNDMINKFFTNLEHFQIENQLDRVSKFSNDDTFYLNLNYEKLKTFYVGLNQHIKNINCPDLIELSLFTELKVTNNQFKNLKYLSCGSLFYIPGTIKFNSLETLVLYEQKSILFLNDFPQLKQIHFFYTWQTSPSFIDTIKLELTNRTSKNLQIFMNGIKIEKIKPFERPINNDYKICKYNLFFRNNYEKSLSFCVPVKSKLFKLYRQNCTQFNFKLTNLGIVYSNEFGKTIDELDQNLVEKFSKCFNNMVIYEQINYDLFSRCNLFFRSVYQIRIKNVDQKLLDLLPSIMPNLRIVYLNPIDLKKKAKNINFHFLTHLYHLNFSIVNLNSLSFDIILNIFDNCTFYLSLVSIEYQIRLICFTEFVIILKKRDSKEKNKENLICTGKKFSEKDSKIFKNVKDFFDYLITEKIMNKN